MQSLSPLKEKQEGAIYGSAHPAAALLIPTWTPSINNGPPLSPFSYIVDNEASENVWNAIKFTWQILFPKKVDAHMRFPSVNT